MINNKNEENIKLVREFAKIEDFSKYEFDQKYTLTDDIFFIRKENFNKELNHLYEDHVKMIDVHFSEEGGEIIRVATANNLKLHKAYDEKIDMTWYKGSGDHKFSQVKLSPGQLVVLHPGECHEPELAVSEENKKVLFKIKL